MTGLEARKRLYSDYVGMVLNSTRLKNGKILDTMRAIVFALSDSDLPASLFEAVAGSRQEAENMAFDANIDRRTARTMREMR